MPELLRDVTELRNYAAPLARLGYTTLDDFFGAYQTAGDALADYLEVSPTALANTFGLVSLGKRAADEALLAEIPFSLGVPDQTLPPSGIAFSLPPAVAVLPPCIDLTAEMPPVRSQGKRQTCVAFAALNCCTHALRASASCDFSPQFLYWTCKQMDNLPSTAGTFLQSAAKALRFQGCCPEAAWRYRPDVEPNNEAQDPVPDAAFEDLRFFDLQAIAPHSVTDLKTTLAGGRCVAVSLEIYGNYHRSPYFARIGKFPVPIPGVKRVGGHAVCLVGYEDTPDSAESPGGGHFIVRNTWGDRWGVSSGYGLGGGYGTVAFAYIERYCREAYVFNGELEGGPK